jgi:N-acetylmuramoyl-L-alanine amidase
VSRKAFPLVKVAKELRPIVIDPGHGGEETGAVGRGGLWEKDVVLEIARRIKAALNEYGGLTVVLTRDSDQFLPLRARSGIANHKNGRLFVSLHTNAHPSTKINTLRVYFQSSNFEENFAQQNFIQRSKALAKTICEFLDDRLGIRDSKVQKIRSPILKDLMMPAVLVEIGFISNPLFEAELQDDEVKNKVAQSISQAIIEYTHLYERR